MDREILNQTLSDMKNKYLTVDTETPSDYVKVESSRKADKIKKKLVNLEKAKCQFRLEDKDVSGLNAKIEGKKAQYKAYCNSGK